MLTTEASVCMYGTLKAVLEGKEAPGGHELDVDYWQLIGSAPPGGADNILNEDSHPDVQLDNRHIMIRGENTAKVLKMRSVVMQAFREHFFSRGYFEVTPPTALRTASRPKSKISQRSMLCMDKMYVMFKWFQQK